MLGGNLFMKKTRSRKSRDTVPLMEVYNEKKGVHQDGFSGFFDSFGCQVILAFPTFQLVNLFEI
jgi:hypothetical protein